MVDLNKVELLIKYLFSDRVAGIREVVACAALYINLVTNPVNLALTGLYIYDQAYSYTDRYFENTILQRKIITWSPIFLTTHKKCLGRVMLKFKPIATIRIGVGTLTNPLPINHKSDHFL